MNAEEAIKWIEEEVHKHGVFNVEQQCGDYYNHQTKITTRVPTGQFEGFTVSSQHVSGGFNLLQLIMKMQEAAMARPRRKK